MAQVETEPVRTKEIEDPGKKVALTFSRIVLAVYSEALSNIVKERGSSLELGREFKGKVEFRLAKRSFDYLVTTKRMNGKNLASIRLDFGDSKRLEVFNSLVLSKDEVRDGGFRHALGGKVTRLFFNIKPSFFWCYEAGGKEDDPDWTPLIRVEARVNTKDKNAPFFEELSQVAVLTNPAKGYPRVESFFKGGVDPWDNNRFHFRLGLGIFDEYQGENVQSKIIGDFIPSEEESGLIYKLFNAKDLNVSLGKNLGEFDEKDLAEFKIYWANISKLVEVSPKRFTGQEVERMLLNVITGKAALTGIWNPLSIPGVRKVGING